MKKKILIIAIIIFIIIAMIISYILMKKYKNPEREINQNTTGESKSVMYEENASVGDLKEEYKITGKDDLYEINTENDGRKVINVKTSINYKVAFSGMIEKSKPDFSEIEKIYQENKIDKNGIWINSDDRDSIINYINNSKLLNNNYEIDSEGYLKITMKNNPNEYDDRLEKVINGNTQIIADISSSYYMVDVVTGDIVENPYNDLSEDQTYEYVKDDNKYIVFISENKEEKLENNDIFVSLMYFLDYVD